MPTRRNRPIPGSRLFLYLGSLVGLYRTAERALDETDARTEKIDPTTLAEPSDLNAKAVFLTGVGLILALWVLVLVLYPLFDYFSYARTGGRVPQKVLQYLPPQPPPPRNQAHPLNDLSDFRAHEESVLNSYQWVDSGKGLVSIPIGEAMRILAERGIPPGKPGGNEYYNPSAGNKLTGFEGKVRPEPR